MESLQVIKGYEIREQIGAGGFGAVYRAYQPAIGREVAIKVILPQFASQPEFIRRFETEAQIVARLEHPHIVPLFDYWRDPEGAYLVMRWLPSTLRITKLVDEVFNAATVVRMIEQVCAALAVAHRNHVIHRDIKPDNILLDEDHNAYLTDFGIASIVDAETASQANVDITGSMKYIAPEQLQGQKATPQADIYSLGIVIYELLTGEHPYGEANLSELIYKHLHEPLPQRSDLSPEVNQIIQRATAKDPTARYESALSLAADLRRALLGDSAAVIPREVDSASIVNPYKGLRAFEEADAADFFGREALTQRLLARMIEEDPFVRFLAVVGPSGSGKSSAVKAGLIPALRMGALPGSENWFAANMVPGDDPLKELEAALLSVSLRPPVGLMGQLQADKQGLLWGVDRALGDTNGDLLLVIDQFEELFTLAMDENQRVWVLDLLYTALTSPESRLRVVATLRADFYDRPLLYENFGTLIQARTQVVLPLSSEEIERAITGPAERAGLRIDTDLVAAVVSDVREEPGALPLLQYALTEVCERREGTRMGLSAYRDIGGVTGALARRADEVYVGLTAESQQIARQVFLRLVTLGEGTEDTRRRVRQTELSALLNESVGMTDESPLQRVLNAFGKYRLLTFDREPDTREPTIEVAHEALLREWRPLREWLDVSRADIRLQRVLQTAAQEWETAGRDPSFLLSGSRLAQFEAFAAETDLALTGAERDYIAASIGERSQQRKQDEARKTHEAALERRSRNVVRTLAAVLLVIVVLSISAGVAIQRGNEAEAARATSDANLGLAVAAQATSDRSSGESRSLVLALNARDALEANQTGLALVLAVEANSMAQPPLQSRQVLATAADEHRAIRRFVGHSDEVQSVAFSPDGQTALSGSYDRTLILWDVASGTMIRRFEGHTDIIRSVAFSPDGQTVLSGSNDGTLILWDIATGAILRHFEGHDDSVMSVTFSPDGQTILSGSSDGIILQWDVASGTIIRRFEGHTDVVRSIVFSPDGQTALSGSFDRTLILWDVASGTMIRRFEGHSHWIYTVAFSPDGQTAISSSNDGTLILWDVGSGERIRRFEGVSENGAITAGLLSVAFSPDGETVLSGSIDGTLILWDVANGTILRRFTVHTDAVRTVIFSPDGRLALSGSADSTLILWEMVTDAFVQRFDGGGDGVRSVALSTGGRLALSGSNDSRLILWDVVTGRVIRLFEGQNLAISSVAFSPDGQTVLSGANDGTLVLWDAASGDILHSFVGHDDVIRNTVFSADGQTVLSGANDGILILWDTATGAILNRFDVGEDIVLSISFSADRRLALFGTSDGTLMLWDVVSGTLIRRFVGHSAAIWSVGFSTDGAMALSGSDDHTLILWDVASGTIIRRFEGHDDAVLSVAFSPNGETALSGSLDGTLILWDVASGALLRRFVGHEDAVLSVTFSSDGATALSGSNDRTMILWAFDPSPGDLLAWVANNRYLPELTCEQRALYQLESCSAEGTFPTNTPPPTVLPLLTPTSSP